MFTRPVILGCSGPVLGPEEQQYFSKLNPLGFILFQRNCENPDQLRRLTDDLRQAVGREDAPIFIDQEGGRVARLKPPYWPALPAMRTIGKLYEKDQALGRKAMHLHALITARMLHDVGINGNFAPVLDLWIEGASQAIGDRALSADPTVVANCARIAVDTYLAHGIIPVIKHMPGHGRVQVDPHVDLPFVDTQASVLSDEDFAPFRMLKNAPAAMNCHVVFRALDRENPVSLSRTVHQKVLRGVIGFEGLIFSDDLAMGAIKIPLEQRAEKALEAGADIVLFCTGNLEDTKQFCEAIPFMDEPTVHRWHHAQAKCAINDDAVDVPLLMARLDRLMDIAVTLAA